FLPYTLPCVFTVTTTTVLYTLSLHDALPISMASETSDSQLLQIACPPSFSTVSLSRINVPLEAYSPASAFQPKDSCSVAPETLQDRKSTRLNSSHDQISYAVFCLKKKSVSTTSQAISCCLTSAPGSGGDQARYYFSTVCTPGPHGAVLRISCARSKLRALSGAPTQ